MATIIDLDRSVRIVEVEAIQADTPLDGEQIEWLVDAYRRIERYVGQTISIRQIHDDLASLGDVDTGANRDWFSNSLDGLLISLRTIRPSEAQNRRLAEYQEAQARGETKWRPCVGNQRLYVTARNGNQLFLGIATPTEIDGEATVSSLPLARIRYEI